MVEPLTIVNNWKNSSNWSTERVPSDRQFDRWCEFVNEAHLRWSIRGDRFDRFPAFIREGRFGDFRLANLTAPGSRVLGTRNHSEIARDSAALYNMLYVVDGSICLTIDDNDVELQPGEIALWDSTRPMVFVTGDRLHQITLAMTHDRLHRTFPNAPDFVGKKVACATGLNRLFADHLIALDEQFGDLTSDQARTVLDATLNMAVSVFDDASDCYRNVRSPGMLRSMCEYIDRNIEDIDLSIAQVAHQHDISLRHLHRLFHEMGISSSAYIVKRRLERCKADLASSFHDRETITDIAFRWGFNDSGTFSKTFRRQYGVSPREFRSSTKL